MAELFPDGRPRLGWLIDGDAGTPEISVMLENVADTLVLTIPTKGMFHSEDPYARWFLSDFQRGDDPGRSQYRYEPPTTLFFVDADGSLTLSGCRMRSMKTGLSVGRGEVVADFGVIGARHLNYSSINGLRSTIPDMLEWSEIASISDSYSRYPDGRLSGANFAVERQPDIKVHRRLNVSLYPTWSTDPKRGGASWTIDQGVDIRTQTARPRPWAEHVELHESLRELVAIAAWRKIGYSAIHAHRTDDPDRVLSGADIGPRWSPVVTSRLPHDATTTHASNFLFRRRDLPSNGIARWIDMRQRYRRALGPITALLDRPSALLERNLADSGASLEALGYQIAADRKQLGSRQQLTYRDALRTIVSDMSFHPIADPGAWIEEATGAYRAVKHPDNPLPDALVALNAHRRNLLMIRYWIAGRLGVNTAVLTQRLSSDPLASMYH